MKTRAEQIEETRSIIDGLREKHGLAFPAADGEGVYQHAKRLELIRRIIAGATKTVIPCKVTLKDYGVADPCLIVPESLPIELLPQHKQVAVGGQVLSLAPSRFTLPKYIMDAAWRPMGSWQGDQLPILVSIRGEYRYLVRPNSYFFRFENFTGQDLDLHSPAEPNEVDLQLDRYHWGDDLKSELTLVVAEF